MKIGQSTEVWHLSILLGHLLDLGVCVSYTFVHCLLGSGHFSFDFFNSFDVAIILLRFWFWHCWFSCKFLSIHLNFLFNCLLSCDKHFLKLGSLGFGLFDGLDVLTVFIDGGIFSLLLLLESLFF